jgi:hypothetical protein
LKTREVSDVLEHAVLRMLRYLRRKGTLEPGDGELDEPVGALVASAVSGQVPPAGPQ